MTKYLLPVPMKKRASKGAHAWVDRWAPVERSAVKPPVGAPSCLTAGFASWRGTSRCVGATTQLDHTRTHIREARVGFETPPATRGQAQGRAVQLAGSSARANPDPPATLGRTRELAKTARARTRERRSHARARRKRGVRGGRLRGEGRVEAFRGSADARALPETGDTARARVG